MYDRAMVRSRIRKKSVRCRKLISTFTTPPVLAAASIANIVKSSLGPVGLDKMLVDEIGVGGFFLFWTRLLFVFLAHSRWKGCHDQQ